MVVRLPQGWESNPQGRVIIPCHRYQTQSLGHLHKLEKYDRQKFKHNRTITVIKTRDVGLQTMIEVEDKETCCDEEECLWNKQFNRWWGWNWLRKRRQFLKKLGIKNCKERQPEPFYKIKKQHIKTDRKDKIPQFFKDVFDTPETSDGFLYTTPINAERIRSPRHFRLSRFKREKHRRRELAPWIMECTSDSDIEYENVKMQPKPNRKSLEESIEYLSLRLHRVNSSKNLLKDHDIRENTCKQNKIFTSPVSGKTYDLTTPKINLTIPSNNIILKPININDPNMLPKPKFDWFEHYTLIKKEHSKLLENVSNLITYTNVTSENKQSTSETMTDNTEPNTVKKCNTVHNNNLVKSPIDQNKLNDTKKENYDLNYIINNIDCFSSQITNTELICSVTNYSNGTVLH